MFAQKSIAGTDGVLTVPTMTSFFRDQRFPENFYRRNASGTFPGIGVVASQIFNAHPVPAGANNADGVYVPDSGPLNVSSSTFTSPFSILNSIHKSCGIYTNLAGENLPAILLNTTGVLKQNVDFLLNTIHNLFPTCPFTPPAGPAGV